MTTFRGPIDEAIADATGRAGRAAAGLPLGYTGVVPDGDRRLFVKTAAADALSAFEAEADGLVALAVPEGPRIPAVIAVGCDGACAYLVTEAIRFGRPAPGARARLGRGLAAIHAVHAEQHGWHRDNTIGATPQSNRRHDDWVRFFHEERLLPQIDRAAAKGAPTGVVDDGRKLAERLPVLFGDHRPAPSLLHGDLWGGNAAFDERGEPVLFDPATYHGDRETDLAMMELFGGFRAEVFAAYREAWHPPPGNAVRRDLYQLYHVLNHFNLFGGAYEAHARRLIHALLAEAG